MSSVTIIIGAQWGDEGKGKWVDILAQSSDAVARFQGGNNAGHTLYINGEKIVLHQIPSGVFNPRSVVALTAGVVMNPVQMVAELKKISTNHSVASDRLWMSARCHVITPWHIFRDEMREARNANPIGTTKRGIGPTYSAKANREGLRLGHYIDPDARKAWLASMTSHYPEFAQFHRENTSAWTEFELAAEELRPFVTDAEDRLRDLVQSGKSLLLEGAQGALLDLDHGTYPFVTSSSTCAGGALASLGFSPRSVKAIYGVAKAYTTRVGSGPFPTEDTDIAGRHMADKGKEFGATTGRARRCGWLDLVALRYAYRTSGMDGIILNKMDILDELTELKVCVAYQHPKLGRIDRFPWDHRILAEAVPVYHDIPGWNCELPKTGKVGDLPHAAKRYIDFVAEYVGGPVVMVGTGVARENALMR
jgi:adenylosuccinate synthase